MSNLLITQLITQLITHLITNYTITNNLGHSQVQRYNYTKKKD